MTDTRTDEIRARDAAATPGPWGTRRDLNGTYTIEHGTYVTREDGFGSDGDVAVLVGSEETAYGNGDFIARARDDVPYLLGRVAELEALAADFIDPDACHFDHHGYCQAHGWFATDPACPHGRAKRMGLEATDEDNA